jgi:7-cyano-7-deazaguanine synthase
MTRKAFVLLSGGMDSTTCLHQAVMDYFPEDPGLSLAYGDKGLIAEALRNGAASGKASEQIKLEIPWVEAFSVHYGQRHKKEMRYAADTCARLGIRHSILDVGAILSGSTVMLTDDSRGVVEVPNTSYADIKGVSPTYVPFRNGTLLSVITAQAQKWVNEENQKLDQLNNEGGAPIGPEDKPTAGVYFGAHSEDAHNWAYPDCTPEFIGAMANAIYIGTYHQVRLHTPIQWSSKQDVVALGERLGVRWADTWSCYKGEDKHCGVCPTCRARREAFVAAGVSDPTEYAS